MATIDEVLKALKAAQNNGRLDVRGSIIFEKDVSKFDQLTFQDQSTLVLSSINSPFIALATKTLLLDIHNPKFRASISRPTGQLEDDIVARSNGSDGAPGDNGNHGIGAKDRAGQPGDGGNEGKPGGWGSQVGFPPVFIFVQNFIFGTDATPSEQYFNFFFRGFHGSSGGRGGRGGNGGNGSNGEQGASGIIDCQSGAGAGGNGGNAGRGGPGGGAGQGGNGGTIYLFAPDASIFNFTTTDIEGGLPGTPGQGGEPGTPGKGGRGGKPNGFCKAGRLGSPGIVLDPPSWGTGQLGIAGVRGVQYVYSRDNSDIFG